MAEVPILTSPLLEALPGVRHAFFTRQGGVSGGVYASLNVGRGSGDVPTDVAENRARAAGVFGRDVGWLASCYQVHSARAVVAETPFGADAPQADGLATRTPGLICGALAADCAPVLIADAEAGIVGALHAGWRGALAGIVGATVEAMISLGAAPHRMVAAIGPCIGPRSYEVGLEFLRAFVDADSANERFFVPGVSPSKRRFDLPAYVLSRLDAAEVGRSEWIGRDTCAEPDHFFSNRRATHRGEADYGRLLSAIMLET